MSTREERLNIINQIGKHRDSKVLVYVTGDRTNAAAQIGDDAVRHLAQHIRELRPIEKLDLFIYSRGGATDVPWRIVTAIRAAVQRWSVLVPLRANSAATMIALGADEIVMGPQGELGPIDPSLGIRRQLGGDGEQTLVTDQVSVEDVMAYVEFMQDRVGISDQEALAVGFSKLADRLDPVALGKVHRTHSHIRDVARRIVLSRAEPPPSQTVDKLVSTLAERVYAHGHAISRSEAEEMGLPVSTPPDELDGLMWGLLEAYETHMNLLSPLDPIGALGNNAKAEEDCVLALIESEAGLHEFKTIKMMEAQRQLPSGLNVAVNLNLQVPPNLPHNQGQALQALMAQVQPAIQQQAAAAVKQALDAQAPIIGVQVKDRTIGWTRSA